MDAHLRAQVTQVYALALRQRTEGLLWTALENALEQLGLPARLANALYDSFFGRDVTTTYYRSLIDASPATARNDLQAAASAGLLAPLGQTRARRYERGRRLMAVLAQTLGNVEPEQPAIHVELMRRAREVTEVMPTAEELRGQQRLPGVP